MKIPGGFKIDNPALPVLQASVAYWGVTSGDGNVLGTTLVCADLDNQPPYAVTNRVKLLTGLAAGQDRLINVHAVGGIETVDSAFSDSTGVATQILAGTVFVILSNSGGGTGGGSGMPPTAALWMFGIVGAAQVASLTVIDIPHLAGFLDDTFNNRFYMEVMHAGGAAPETQVKLITDYDGTLGRFTTDAFTVNVEAYDVVAIYLTAVKADDIVARGTFTLSDLVQPEDNTRTEGNGFFKGNLIMPTEGACANQARLLTSYTGVGGVFDIDPGNPFSNLPGLVDYVILKFQTPFAPPADAVENRLPSDTIGHKADTAVAAVDGTSSIMRYVKGILNAVGGASLSAVFQEQADVPVDITAINGGQTDVFHLNAATTRYLVRSLRLKCADPGANTVSVRLYRLINDGLILVDTFEITTLNFDTHYSLMDMFGVPYLAGDELQVTVQVDAGGPYAVIGQYSHATAT